MKNLPTIVGLRNLKLVYQISVYLGYCGKIAKNNEFLRCLQKMKYNITQAMILISPEPYGQVHSVKGIFEYIHSKKVNDKMFSHD